MLCASEWEFLRTVRTAISNLLWDVEKIRHTVNSDRILIKQQEQVSCFLNIVKISLRDAKQLAAFERMISCLPYDAWSRNLIEWQESMSMVSILDSIFTVHMSYHFKWRNMNYFSLFVQRISFNLNKCFIMCCFVFHFCGITLPLLINLLLSIFWVLSKYKNELLLLAGFEAR